MKVWKHTPLDAILLTLGVGHFVTLLLMAAVWERSPLVLKCAGLVLVVCLLVYHIIVVTHLFTHTPWFESRRLNALASMLNSLNIGQSAQAYHLTHVRNHHRYNNDRPGPDGKIKDLSSTFMGGEAGQHASLFRYAFMGALSTLLGVGRTLISLPRLWRVGRHEHALLGLLSTAPGKRAAELRQVQLDRIAHFLGGCLFFAISWRWTLFCYLPGFYLALVLVNVQNYYEHYGAEPEQHYANSVSYYGRLYNLLTFYDGYHQEHHLRPNAHWTRMPEVRLKQQEQLDKVGRVVSPVPAIVGFLHRGRMRLSLPRGVAVSSPPSREGR